MLAKPHCQSQQVTCFYVLILLIYLYLIPDCAESFKKQIEKITTGEPYPHILKKDTFSLNTRNIKVLKAGKKYLWIGTNKGLINYDTKSAEIFEVYDNKSKTVCHFGFWYHFCHWNVFGWDNLVP